MSHLQFQSKRFILRHAWLNLWDERITTGRINQVAILFFSITSSEVACDKHTSPNTIYAVGYLFSIWEWEHNAVCPVIQKGDVTISWDLSDVKCAEGLSPKTGRKQMITNTFDAFSPLVHTSYAWLLRQPTVSPMDSARSPITRVRADFAPNLFVTPVFNAGEGYLLLYDPHVHSSWGYGTFTHSSASRAKNH